LTAERSQSVNTTPDGSDALADLLKAGRDCFALRDYAQAAECCDRAIDMRHDCAEAHLLRGDVYAASGDSEDALDCYQLAVHFSPQHAPAQTALAEALLERGSDVEAEAACRRALSAVPGFARAWLCLGNIRKRRGELAEAADAYRAAWSHDRAETRALEQLAFVLSRLGQYDKAFEHFRALLDISPDSHRAHHNFGLLQLETGYAAEALASFTRALQLQPETVESLTCVGHALRDLGRVEEAIAYYDQALALRPAFGDALANRALALLRKGDFANGWTEYEHRFQAGGKQRRTIGAPVWRGEPLQGKSVVVLSEQGVGDEIMFASCLPDLIAAAGRVTVACEARLTELFQRSFQAAVVLPRESAEGTPPAAPVAADFEISIGSLPLRFRPTADSFPRTGAYLKADAEKLEHWRQLCISRGPRLHVGIAWRGGTLRNRQRLRSLELNDLERLTGASGCDWISLQAGDQRETLERIRDRAGVEPCDAMRDIGQDLDELAAAISALDLVITVDNTIAHLSGALGRPVWVLLPYSAEWRYGQTTSAMPWYPSMRLFRQTAPRDWSSVIAEIRQCLQRGV
jgi:tetratricopeptide (TPR) repeat protein